MLKYFAIFLLLLASPLAQASDKTELAYNHAQQLKKSSRYEEALVEFQEIEREFPYSKYAKLSKLKIADIHFEMANYIQAQYQYQYYYDLYPKAADSDYALYQVGLSVYKQVPKTIDRDLSKTSDALKFWRKALVKFPQSKYTEKILEKQKELINKLGRKELYIASFYLKRKKYVSAQKRFGKLFSRFPSFKENKKALKKALECSKKIGDEPAMKFYENLLTKAPS